MKKYALVTGCSRGLGLELCGELVEQGYQVYALVRSATPEILELQGETLRILAGDVTDMASLQQARKQMDTDRLDVLINNAGIWLDKSRATLEQPEFDPETILPQVDVNAAGVVRVAKVFVPLLLAGEEKLLINVSSEAGSITASKRMAEYGYCMSKAAENMATKLLHNDLNSKGVRVMAVHPGWMMTEMGMAGAKPGSRPQQDPRDSARQILAMAKDPEKKELFYHIDGRPWPW